MSDTSGQLVIDLGGTNIRFGLVAENTLSPTHMESYTISSFPELEQAIAHYLSQYPHYQPQQAAIAVAGPVTGDHFQLTNFAWAFRISDLCKKFGFKRFKMINDFTALALSLPLLQADELVQVGGGEAKPDGTIALVGPGTGLGVSGLLHTKAGYYPLSGEGGHVSLGARSSRELAIFDEFHKKYGHMSAERLLSGTGLGEVYQVIRRLDQLDATALPVADIAHSAIEGSCASCMETMSMFCEWLGVIASDLVVTLGANGGLYIGGGIVPKLGDYFLNSNFRQQFETKGRFREFMETVPCYVIRAEHPALYGAAASLDEQFSELGHTEYS